MRLFAVPTYTAPHPSVPSPSLRKLKKKYYKGPEISVKTIFPHLCRSSQGRVGEGGAGCRYV